MRKNNYYHNLSDEALVNCLKQDDQRAFTQIFDRYWTPLVLHAGRMVGDSDLAQDLVQEVFYHIYANLDRFQITSSLSSYLYTAVRNRVFSNIKHGKVKASYFESIASFFENGVYQIDQDLNAKELAAIIEAEIEKMPAKMKEIFELSRKDQLSHKEIASLLDISEHTVRNQIKRALKKLQQNHLLKGYVLFMTLQAMESQLIN